MDCPSCQSFNSVLDEECDACRFPLPPPRRTGYLYRSASAKPSFRIRRRLKHWARLALAYGEQRSDLASVLLQRGYDEAWARTLVNEIQPLYIRPYKRLERIWERFWMPSPEVRKRRLWFALLWGAFAILPRGGSWDDTSLRGVGGGFAQPCEMGLSAICTDPARS